MTSTVLCFQHCDRSTNIFCFCVPTVCPLCGVSTETSESRIPPFEIASPFSDASEHPFSVVIRPTNQQFLNGYRDGDNLHIGLTTSQGQVYEFDEDGVHTMSPAWTSCIVVPILSPQSYESWKTQWDSSLLKFAAKSEWAAERYDESSHNCFDFVLGFLRSLPLGELSPLNVTSKHKFCEDLVASHTLKLGKYIILYKQIEECGFVCVPATS